MEIKRKTSKWMTTELSKKLVDSELMHKYGTSLEINMSRDYEKNINRKYQFLKLEFEKINKNSDDVISFDELKDFIFTYSSQVIKFFMIKKI
jgi:ABC-type polysaccharide/polyol phosphate transport system ATPase subunit